MITDLDVLDDQIDFVNTDLDVLDDQIDFVNDELEKLSRKVDALRFLFDLLLKAVGVENKVFSDNQHVKFDNCSKLDLKK
jgi:hypothetical protein